MQISVSSTLTLYYDGQFWVGLAERIEDGRLGVARIVFGAEPSDEEILQFVVWRWEKLPFFEGDAQQHRDSPIDISGPATQIPLAAEMAKIKGQSDALRLISISRRRLS